MKFKDGKTFSAYVRSKLHSGYITLITMQRDAECILVTKNWVTLKPTSQHYKLLTLCPIY